MKNQKNLRKTQQVNNRIETFIQIIPVFCVICINLKLNQLLLHPKACSIQIAFQYAFNPQTPFNYLFTFSFRGFYNQLSFFHKKKISDTHKDISFFFKILSQFCKV